MYRAPQLSSRRRRLAVAAAALAVGLPMITIVMATPAAAEPVPAPDPVPAGFFAPFDQCPAQQIQDLVTAGKADPVQNGCTAAVTTGGSFVVGGNYIPITADAILQEGQYQVAGSQDSVALPGKDGKTFTSSPMRVPGGLLGFPSIENTFPGFTDLKATVELAGDATPNLDIFQLFSGGVVVSLPVKIKLTNNILGPNCYIGSDTDPIVLNLQAAATNPPAPNRPISGNAGTISSEQHGNASVLTAKGVVLVDNSFRVPEAQGCGPFGGILNPVVNFKEGLPSAPGNNIAILEQTAYIGGTAADVLANPPTARK